MSGVNLFDLTGRVSLVTGAGGRGLGRAICEALAENGSDVVFSYCTDEVGAKETADIIAQKGVKVLAIKADVSNQQDVKAMFSRVDQEFGKIDILFNNAGVTTKSVRLHEMSLEDWIKPLNVNLTGVFFCMQEGIKLMRRQKKGSIINISSLSGLIAFTTRCSYSVSKAGVMFLTRIAAVDYGPDGIRVNTIVPGVFPSTKIYSSWTKEEMERRMPPMINQIPLRRVGELDDMKGTALYLASDASSYVTGHTFLIDGGVAESPPGSGG